jgi:hypothetical protein
MLRFVALRGQHGGGKRYATDALRSCRGGCRQSPGDPWVHTPATMAPLTYYLLLWSDARTRRLADCKTAVSALSRRSYSRYSRTA